MPVNIINTKLEKANLCYPVETYGSMETVAGKAETYVMTAPTADEKIMIIINNEGNFTVTASLLPSDTWQGSSPEKKEILPMSTAVMAVESSVVKSSDGSIKLSVMPPSSQSMAICETYVALVYQGVEAK